LSHADSTIAEYVGKSQTAEFEEMANGVWFWVVLYQPIFSLLAVYSGLISGFQVCIYVYVCMYIRQLFICNRYMYLRLFVSRHLLASHDIHAYLYICKYSYIFIYTHLYIYIYIFTYMYIYIHIYMCTCIDRYIHIYTHVLCIQIDVYRQI